MIILNVLLLVLGMFFMIKGADFFVEGSSNIAKLLKIPSLIIGLTLVSIGTSAPELSVSIQSSLALNTDLSFGNVIGSNIFNMLLIIGASALIKPIVYNLSYNIDMIFTILATLILALFPIIPPKNKMTRTNGIIYVIIYIVYLVTLFIK